MGFIELNAPATSEPQALPRSTRRKRTWLPVLAVLLTTFGIHYFSPSHTAINGDAFPGIPQGNPGTVSLVPCANDMMECGYVIVPKDYTNSSVGTAAIAVARAPAPSGHSKGTVFLNPGGPGGSGVDFLSRAAPLLHQLIGPDWDLLGFDPRGIGRTRPETKCFPDDMTEQLFLENTVLHQGYTIPNTVNISDPLNRLSLTVQARQFLAIKEAQAKLCHENMDVEDLKYMGTTTVVRDIDFMTKTLDGESAKINYWGASYGSILGAYLVNMLPDRIGYSLIDGIVDPIVWANKPSHQWHKYWSSSAENAYQWFLNDCSKAGPVSCPLTKAVNEDPTKIESRIEAFIQGLVTHPLPAIYNGRPGYITSGAARGVLFLTLASPSLYQITADAFAKAMQPARDGSLLLRLVQYTSASQDLGRLGVVCADTPSDFTDPTAEDLADEFIWALNNTSKHFGAAMDFIEHDGGCEFWPTRGRVPERFTGPWNASLAYPLLIISNTADPDTPIANGLIVNEHMPNSSTILIQNGPGHTSNAAVSLCTIKAQLSYWAGEPPKNGTVCELSSSTFPDSDLSAVDTMPAEDRALIGAARKMGSILEGMRRSAINRLL